MNTSDGKTTQALKELNHNFCNIVLVCHYFEIYGTECPQLLNPGLKSIYCKLFGINWEV